MYQKHLKCLPNPQLTGNKNNLNSCNKLHLRIFLWSTQKKKSSILQRVTSLMQITKMPLQENKQFSQEIPQCRHHTFQETSKCKNNVGVNAMKLKLNITPIMSGCFIFPSINMTLVLNFVLRTITEKKQPNKSSCSILEEINC